MQNVAQFHRSSGAIYGESVQNLYPVQMDPYTGHCQQIAASALPSPPSTPSPVCSQGPRRQFAPSRQQQYGLATPPASPAAPMFDQAEEWATYFDPGNRLQLISTLGSGAYGVVHLARDVLTQIPYAVKVLNKFTSNGLPLDSRQQLFQRTEMQLHYEVSAHPNIVSLLRILDVADCTYVVMEYCPEGDLFSNITEQGRYVGNDLAAKDVFLQILDAVSHCHRLGVYHRDLKPENILVSDGGNQVKLADFGLATTDKYSTEFGCGSTFYMSPECQNQSTGIPYYACAPNDIWSLGVILVNLTCGRNPWKSASAKDSTFRAYMEDRQFLKSILPLSDELNQILGMIFELDPNRRITLEELRHRIIHCPQFTKRASEPAALPVKVVDQEYTYNELLSPCSSISEEGSMVSDHSDNSTVPSEVDATSEYDFSVEVMDEDCDPTLQDVEPVNLPKACNTFYPETSYVTVETPKTASHADVVLPAPTFLQVPANTGSKLASATSTQKGSAKKTRQAHGTRCVTPSQLSLLSFCPDQRRMTANVWRAF